MQGFREAKSVTGVWQLYGQIVREVLLDRGVDLISDALPFGGLWHDGLNAVGYAMHRSRVHRAVIYVYDDAGNVIATHEHAGDFVEP